MAKEYPPEVKAAVMAALLSGQTVSSVAKEFDLPKGTVSGWRAKAELIVKSPGVAGVATQNRREEVKELLVDLLLAQLRSQIAMAEHAGDKSWLKMQRADAVAILFGVGNDKVYRLLEALGSGSVGSEPRTTES